jgi:hypothetical protein
MASEGQIGQQNSFTIRPDLFFVEKSLGHLGKKNICLMFPTFTIFIGAIHGRPSIYFNFVPRQAVIPR